MIDLIQSMLPMNLDIYRQTDIQDDDTGAIKKEWSYYSTIPCYAKSIISNSSTSRSGDTQSFSNKYKNEQNIQVRTESKISLRHKVSNIKDRDGKSIWTEQDYPSETPTVFEVIGSSPVTDPFGRVIGYNSSLKRSENQQIGI